MAEQDFNEDNPYGEDIHRDAGRRRYGNSNSGSSNERRLYDYDSEDSQSSGTRRYPPRPQREEFFGDEEYYDRNGRDLDGGRRRGYRRRKSRDEVKLMKKVYLTQQRHQQAVQELEKIQMYAEGDNRRGKNHRATFSGNSTVSGGFEREGDFYGPPASRRGEPTRMRGEDYGDEYDDNYRDEYLDDYEPVGNKENYGKSKKRAQDYNKIEKVKTLENFVNSARSPSASYDELPPPVFSNRTRETSQQKQAFARRKEAQGQNHERAPVYPNNYSDANTRYDGDDDEIDEDAETPQVPLLDSSPKPRSSVLVAAEQPPTMDATENRAHRQDQDPHSQENRERDYRDAYRQDQEYHDERDRYREENKRREQEREGKREQMEERDLGTVRGVEQRQQQQQERKSAYENRRSQQLHGYNGVPQKLQDNLTPNLRQAPEIMTPSGLVTYHPPVDHVPQVDPEDDGRWVTESMRGINRGRNESDADFSDDAKLTDTSSVLDGRRLTTESHIERARLSQDTRTSTYTDGNPVMYAKSSASGHDPTRDTDTGIRAQNYVQQVLLDPHRLSPVAEDAFSEGRLTVTEDGPPGVALLPGPGALTTETGGTDPNAHADARRERLRQLGGVLSSEEQRSLLATLRQRRRHEEHHHQHHQQLQQPIPEHEQLNVDHGGIIYDGHYSDPRAQAHAGNAQQYGGQEAAYYHARDLLPTPLRSSGLGGGGGHPHHVGGHEREQEQAALLKKQQEEKDLDAVRRKRMDERLQLARQQEEEDNRLLATAEDTECQKRSSIAEKKKQMQEQREERRNEERVRQRRLEEKLRMQKRL